MAIDRESLKIWDRLVTTIEKATVDNNRLKTSLGQRTIEIVKERTQRGFGVVKKKLEAFPGLKKSTKRRRRTLRKSGKLSSRTTPETDNMTRSGQLTNSLKYEVEPDGVNVKIVGSKNETKARENPDRVLMDVTKKEEAELTKIVADEIVRALRKF